MAERVYDDQTPPTVRLNVNKNAEGVDADDFLDSSDDETENIPREEPFTKKISIFTF